MMAAKTTSFFFSGGRRHTSSKRDWSSDVCSSDLGSRERGRSCRDLVGGHDKIALVLAILVVDDHEDASRADLLDGRLDARKPRHVAPLSASDRRSEERRVGKEWGSRLWSHNCMRR